MIIIGGILCAFGILIAILGIEGLIYNGIIFGLFYLIVGVFLFYAGYGIIERVKRSAGKNNHKTIRSNVPGRSCFDCTNCNSKRADRKKGMIYCDYDSTYYYPETGHDCKNFKDFRS